MRSLRILRKFDFYRLHYAGGMAVSKLEKFFKSQNCLMSTQWVIQRVFVSAPYQLPLL